MSIIKIVLTLMVGIKISAAAMEHETYKRKFVSKSNSGIASNTTFKHDAM